MIEVRNLVKSFEEKEVLKGINATFHSGATNLIIGSSGAGKTVLLKCLFGLIEPTSGDIIYDGESISAMNASKMKKLRLNMGVMFQGSALFDNLTILGNTMFPLDMFSKDRREIRKQRAMQLLERVGLAEAAHKYPSEISGGMMKRAALARALVNKPHYLFCDEPNSGLDPKTSETIDRLIHELTTENNITTVINTHDMNSVRTIGDHIIFLHQGLKNWEGTHTDLDVNPTPELRKFIDLPPSATTRI